MIADIPELRTLRDGTRRWDIFTSPWQRLVRARRTEFRIIKDFAGRLDGAVYFLPICRYEGD
jgi:hypothetical protein